MKPYVVSILKKRRKKVLVVNVDILINIIYLSEFFALKAAHQSGRGLFLTYSCKAAAPQRILKSCASVLSSYSKKSILSQFPVGWDKSGKQPL